MVFNAFNGLKALQLESYYFCRYLSSRTDLDMCTEVHFIMYMLQHERAISICQHIPWHMSARL